MIERDEVIRAYRIVLHREPENEAVIEQQRDVSDFDTLLHSLMGSMEYLLKSRAMLSASDVHWTYQEFLARPPESEESVQESLTSGTLGNLIRRILGSDEFRIKNGQLFALPDQWVIHESPRGFRLWVNMADVSVSGQVMRGSYEPDEVAFLCAQLAPGQTVLDIGANIGYLTHVMAKAVGPEGRVISFEPHPVIHERLAMSIAENGLSQCTTYNVALSDTTGTGAMEFGLDTPNFGGMRLLDAAGAGAAKSISVPVWRLDDLLDPSVRVDFIKIDVEGNEPLVFRGAAKFFQSQRPVIMSEILGDSLTKIHGMLPVDYVAQVCGLGYECRSLKAGGQIGEVFDASGPVAFANVVFLPQD